MDARRDAERPRKAPPRRVASVVQEVRASPRGTAVDPVSSGASLRALETAEPHALLDLSERQVLGVLRLQSRPRLC